MIIRQHLTKAIGLVACALAIGGFNSVHAQESKTLPKIVGKPNIVVILADDLSCWDISHFG